MKNYVQFGSGNIYVKGWRNYDASPTLLIQQIPIFGKIVKSKLNVIFEEGILYGDVVRGLPEKSNSLDGIFSSHTLEHLALNDFNKALLNCYDYLKPGGIMRAVMPNLQHYVNLYIQESEIGDDAAINFIKRSYLGRENSRISYRNRMLEALGNSRHQWLWDYKSFKKELDKVGFIDIEEFKFGESDDKYFLIVERPYQFESGAIAIQCIKPYLS